MYGRMLQHSSIHRKFFKIILYGAIMKNKCLVTTLGIIVAVIVLNLMVSAQSADDSDESKIKKYEVGGQFTILRQKSYQENSQVFDVIYPDGFRYQPLADSHQTEYGFGGRFTYNFNKNVAVETEANFFPVNRLLVTGRESERIFGTNEFFRNFLEPQGRKFQAVAGPKIGYRGKKVGVFGKVRPGLFYIERLPVVEILSLSPPQGIGSSEKKATLFSVDLGAVFEYYPSKQTVLRFDLGDTIIRYNAQDPKPFNPGFTRHTLQTSVGFGFRF
jgi:hypothetical protein